MVTGRNSCLDILSGWFSIARSALSPGLFLVKPSVGVWWGGSICRAGDELDDGVATNFGAQAATFAFLGVDDLLAELV